MQTANHLKTLKLPTLKLQSYELVNRTIRNAELTGTLRRPQILSLFLHLEPISSPSGPKNQENIDSDLFKAKGGDLQGIIRALCPTFAVHNFDVNLRHF